MEFGLSEEQTLLTESIGRFLKSHAALERVRRYVDENEARAADVWEGLCELGVPGLIIAEQHGGIGLKLIDAALVAETLGYGAAPVPFPATSVMAPIAIALAGSEAQQSRWLPELASGKVVSGAAFTEAVHERRDAGLRADNGALNGKATFVLDFEADVYLVADSKGAMYLVEADAAGLSRRRYSAIDKTRAFGELLFENVAADRLANDADGEAFRKVLDAGRVILAADTLGAAQCMLDKAVAYSKERVQFGRVIGSFQAVKHMCAEMAADLEPCRAMVWYAAHAFDAIPDEARLTTCHTKAHLAEVGTFVARKSTEVHGGIGFTDELGLHYWFKRIGANRQLLGGPDHVREEAARLQQLV